MEQRFVMEILKAIRIMQEELESETVQIGARIDWSKSIRTRYFA